MRNVMLVVMLLFACAATAVNVTVYLTDQSTVQGRLVTISSFTVTLIPNGQSTAQTYNSQVAQGLQLEGSENRVLFPIDPATAPEEIRLYIHEAPAAQQARAVNYVQRSNIMPDVYLGPSIGFGLGIQNSSGINEHFIEGDLAAGAVDFTIGLQLGYRDCARLEYMLGWRGTTVEFDGYYNYDGTPATLDVVLSFYRVNLKVAPWNINGNHKLNRFNVFAVGSLGRSKCSFDQVDWDLNDGTLTSFGLEFSRMGYMGNSGQYYDLAFTLEYEQNRYKEWDFGVYGIWPETVKINTVRLGVHAGLCFNLSGSSHDATPQ